MTRNLQLATLILTASLAAVAQNSDTRLYRSTGNEWIQEIHGTLPAARSVRVKSSAGAIHVQGAQQSAVTYTVREHVRAASEEAARREFARLKFSTSSAGETVLRAMCEGYNQSYIDFDVQVPMQTAWIRLETQGGPVTAKNITGRVAAATGGGSIQLDQIGGVIMVSSGGGDIDIGKVGGNVDASTGGGNIHLESAAGQVTASSGGGNLRIGDAKWMQLHTGGGWIQVGKCEGQIKAETGGGSIELTDVRGPARIESGGGSIKVGSISGGVSAETGSGPIVATLRGGSMFSDSRLETSVGDIVVFVPDNLGVTIRAAVEAARGDGIRSEFPELKVTRSSDYGPREFYAEGNLNGGGPVLHVHTATGNIVIKRKGKE